MPTTPVMSCGSCVTVLTSCLGRPDLSTTFDRVPVTISSLSLSIYIFLSRFQRLMTVARDKLYLCGISIAADGLYLARGLQALKIIFVEIELQIGEVIKCC